MIRFINPSTKILHQVEDNAMNTSRFHEDKIVSTESEAIDALEALRRTAGKDRQYHLRNKLDDYIISYSLENNKLAKFLNIKAETISKHRHGKSPISFEMAEKYSDVLFDEYNITSDPLSLMTSKCKDSDLYENSLAPGQMEIIGHFDRPNREVKLFNTTERKMSLTCEYLTHWMTVATPEVRTSVIMFSGWDDRNTFDEKDFYMQDFHYWLCIHRPIAKNIIHRNALNSLSICKLKGSDKIIIGQLFEKPRRTRKAPRLFQLLDEEFLREDYKFLPEDMNLDGVELDWATPVITSVLNPSAQGMRVVFEDIED
jgi:hypothetical protein